MHARATRSGGRRLPLLMGVVAVSLAAMSVLHFTHVLVGSGPFAPERAGTAEAVLCVVLLVGCPALLLEAPRARAIAIAALVVTIAGFLVGLTFTIRGGGALDIAYHAVVLPLLLLMLLVLVRPETPSGSRQATA